MGLDVIINFLTKGVSDVQDDARKTVSAIEDIDKAGDGIGGGLEDGADKALLFNERMQSLAQSGEFLSNIGQKASAMASEFTNAAKEAGGVEARFDSILKAQGDFGDKADLEDIVVKIRTEGSFDDDGEIQNSTVLLKSFGTETEHVESLLRSSARQARTMRVSLDSVAIGMGKAYSSGNVSALARSGLAFEKSEKDAIKAAYAISKTAGQMKFMEIVTAAVNRNTASLSDSLTEAQKNANNFAYEWGEMQETIGKGSAGAEANVQGILASVVKLAGANPQILESAGAWLYYGGHATTAAGSVLQVAGNAGMALQGVKALGISGSASMAGLAITAGTVAAALALIVTTAAAAFIAVKGVQDAQSMSDENLEKKWGGLGTWWKNAGDKLGSGRFGAWNYGGLDHFDKGEEAEKKSRAMNKKRARARSNRAPVGGTHITFDDLKIADPFAKSAARS